MDTRTTALALHRVAERLETHLGYLEDVLRHGHDADWDDYLTTAATYAAVLAQLTPSRQAELCLHRLETHTAPEDRAR